MRRPRSLWPRLMLHRPSRRTTRRGSWDDPVVTVVDNAVGLGALAAVACSVDGSDQFGPLTDWVFNLVLWNSAATASGLAGVGPGLGMVGATAVTYCVVVGRRSSQRGFVLTNAAQFLLFFAAGSGLIRSLRRSEREVKEARQVAVEAAEATAAEQERLRLTVDVHARVLGALEEIASLWGHDRNAARSVARAEALRLRQLVSPDGTGAAGLALSMAEAAVGFARQGVSVELTCDVETEPSVPAKVALTAGDWSRDRAARARSGCASLCCARGGSARSPGGKHSPA